MRSGISCGVGNRCCPGLAGAILRSLDRQPVAGPGRNGNRLDNPLDFMRLAEVRDAGLAHCMGVRQFGHLDHLEVIESRPVSRCMAELHAGRVLRPGFDAGVAGAWPTPDEDAMRSSASGSG